MELDDILNGQEPEETVVAEAAGDEPQAEAEAQPGQPRDEHGRFAPKGETAPAEEPAPAAPPAAENVGPPPGLLEERRKRQEAETRIQEMERQLQSLQAQPRQAPQPPHIPSVYEDENGFAEGLMQTAVLQAREQLFPEVQAQIANMRLELAREMMRAAHPDFDEVERVFLDLSQQNPALRSYVGQQPNPVRAAYDYTRKHMEVQKLGSMDLDAIKKAAVQEYLSQQQPPAPAAPPIPTSLADSQSSRAATAGAWSPPSLDDILARK